MTQGPAPQKPPAAAPDDPRAASMRVGQAMRRTGRVMAWERAWPHLARALTIAGLFVAVSWAGLWLHVPALARLGGALVFGFAFLLSLVPLVRLRWPSQQEVLARLDHGAGLHHRPVTAITDTLPANADPVTQALWQVHLERTLQKLGNVRAPWPRSRLALSDPMAWRAGVMLMLVATFFASEGDRARRIMAAFAWTGALPESTLRVDAWVTPPRYTGRAPILVTGAPAKADGAAANAGETWTVPAGSTLVIRASGGSLRVSAEGAIEAAPAPDAAAKEAAKPEFAKPEGVDELRYVIKGEGRVAVKAPRTLGQWHFAAIADAPPRISFVKAPERQARGALMMIYKVEDDYGVSRADAQIALADESMPRSAAPRPLVEAPSASLVLPRGGAREGVAQTIKDFTDHPWAGAKVRITLVAHDEAGNEGRSESLALTLPERVFAKPLARALVELRRMLALDANTRPLIAKTLDALLVAPEVFTPELGVYLGLRAVDAQLEHAVTDDQLREVVASLWALAVTIEDGNLSEAEKALRAAQEALRQALERGASDDEIKKLTEQLRAAMENYMRQLAEQMQKNPQQAARPLDRNTQVLRPQDLRNMLERMEQLSRSGDKEGARRLLEQLQSMLENLRMARPQQGGEGDAQSALNELSDIVRKQQQLRDRTFQQGQDARRDRNRGLNPSPNLGDLQKDQQNLRDRLSKLLDDLRKQGAVPQPGQNDDGAEGKALGDAGDAMGDAQRNLGQGSPDDAADAQGRALDALRRGAQGLAQALQQQMGRQQGEGQGEGPSNQVGRQENGGPNADPLGRPLRGRDYGDDTSVRVPGELDVQRVRRILEELRRRLSDPDRPKLELDYLERLLKDE